MKEKRNLTAEERDQRVKQAMLEMFTWKNIKESIWPDIKRSIPSFLVGSIFIGGLLGLTGYSRGIFAGYEAAKAYNHKNPPPRHEDIKVLTK